MPDSSRLGLAAREQAANLIDKALAAYVEGRFEEARVPAREAARIYDVAWADPESNQRPYVSTISLREAAFGLPDAQAELGELMIRYALARDIEERPEDERTLSGWDIKGVSVLALILLRQGKEPQGRALFEKLARSPSEDVWQSALGELAGEAARYREQGDGAKEAQTLQFTLGLFERPEMRAHYEYTQLLAAYVNLLRSGDDLEGALTAQSHFGPPNGGAYSARELVASLVKELLERGESERATALLGTAIGIDPAHLPPTLAERFAEEPALFPRFSELAPDKLAEAVTLIDQALPLIVQARYDRSRPLMEAAAKIYAPAWPLQEWEAEPYVLTSSLRELALALAPDLPDLAELMVRYALVRDFAHGKDDIHTEFGSYEADALTSLALLLYRGGKETDAGTIFRLLGSSENEGVRSSALQTLNGEMGRHRAAEAPARAEEVATFALGLFERPDVRGGYDYGDLRDAAIELRRTRGDYEGALDIQMRFAAPSEEGGAFATRQLAGKLGGDLFDRGEFERAAALVARASGSDPARPDLAMAEILADIDNSATIAPAQSERLELLLLSIYEQVLEPTDQRIIRAHNALGNTYLALNRLDDAETHLRNAVVLSEKAGGADSFGTISDTRILAELLMRIERPGEAEALLRRVWAMTDLAGELVDTDYWLISKALTDTLIAQGKLEEADYLTQEIASNVASSPDLAENLRANHEVNRARVLVLLGRDEEAERILLPAQQKYPLPRILPEGEVGDIDLSWGLKADIAQNLAVILERRGDYPEAERQRRPFFERFSLEGTQAVDTLRRGTELATNLSNQGRTAEAEGLFAQLMAAALDEFGEGGQPVSDIGQAYAAHLLRAGQTGQALKIAEQALAAEVAQAQGVSLSAEDSEYLARSRRQRSAAWLFARTAFAADSQDAFPAQVFAAFQRSELTAAGAALARRAARDAAEATGAAPELAAWEAARSRLAALDARIATLAQTGEAGDKERLGLTASRSAIEAGVRQAEGALAAKFPRYFELISAQPVGLEEFQGAKGLLHGDEALVLLAPGSPGLPEGYRNGLVAVVTREASAWAPIQLDAAQLGREIYVLHQQLAAPGTGETLASGYPAPTIAYSRERAHTLYQALFGDPKIAALLKDKERWTLAPQGSLISLPFAALVTAPPPGGGDGDADPNALRQTNWLGFEHSLTLVPSVPSIALQRRAPTRADNAGIATPFFGLGDPAFRGTPDPDPEPEALAEAAPPRGTATYFRSGSADPAAIATLDRLPATAREIRDLAETLGAGPSSFVLQMNSSEAELRRRDTAGDLGKAQVVAFATHGLLGGELDRMISEPALALTPPTADNGEANAENDGLLTASEAASLKLSAKWLILSACNTASAGSADAEGLSGLARAFLQAGARSLLVSHFPIFDDAAPHLTGGTIRLAEQEALSPARALREAMHRLFLNEQNDAIGYSFAHPKSWAPFALIDAN
ncbi:CHAT domain-containing tetratricopeptide repeat protein [Altererythrobacter fulvus]|uniref:CHAT domain-containing tetratricopeptide repeat protein n=1 Tax=Caenibius fulvus TaxID=2126012 RepID=UPI0030165160